MNYLLQRRQILAQNLKKLSVEGILVTHPANVTYLTGFTGGDSFFFGGAKTGGLVSDTRYEEQIKEECFGIEEQKEGESGGHYPRAIKPRAGKDEGLEAYVRG